MMVSKKEQDWLIANLEKEGWLLTIINELPLVTHYNLRLDDAMKDPSGVTRGISMFNIEDDQVVFSMDPMVVWQKSED